MFVCQIFEQQQRFYKRFNRTKWFKAAKHNKYFYLCLDISSVSYRKGLLLSKQGQISFSFLFRRDRQNSRLLSKCLSSVWSLSKHHMYLLSSGQQTTILSVHLSWIPSTGAHVIYYEMTPRCPESLPRWPWFMQTDYETGKPLTILSTSLEFVCRKNGIGQWEASF